jgi:hypothetical protein
MHSHKGASERNRRGVALPPSRKENVPDTSAVKQNHLSKGPGILERNTKGSSASNDRSHMKSI